MALIPTRVRKSLPVSVLSTAFLSCMLLFCMSITASAQEAKLAKVRPIQAGLAKFTGNSWTGLPECINATDYYVTVVESKRDKFPTAFTLKVLEPGLVIMSTPMTEPPPDPQISEDTNNGFSFVPPSEFVDKGWEPVGMAVYAGIPHAVLRKNFAAVEDVSMTVQRNRAPFVFVTSKPEYATAIASLPTVSLAVESDEPSVTTTTDVTFNIAPNGGDGAPNMQNDPGQPSAGPPQSSGFLGALIGIAQSLSGGGPQGAPPDAFPATPPGGAPAQAIPPANLKQLFIASVPLDKMKCAVTRKEVDRQFYMDYREGVVFFSDAEAMEKFKENELPYSPVANYQLFLTGQATQVLCPLSRNSFDEEYSLGVGFDKEVYFNSMSELRELQGKDPGYVLTKIFGNTAFERSFEVAIPQEIPAAIPEANPNSAPIPNINRGGRNSRSAEDEAEEREERSSSRRESAQERRLQGLPTNGGRPTNPRRD
ncbi:MAG: hypothetical protein CMJ46_01860 [Planctomyces sp.]|nr:hypothetical protein [Planctomyces sp.]